MGRFSDVAKGGRGAVRPWRHFYGGGTMGYAAVSYKPAKAVQYWNKSDLNVGAVLAVKDVFDFE